MKYFAAFAALSCASPAYASDEPYKLVVLWGNDGVAITDYKTKADCERAVASLRYRKYKEVEERKPHRTEGGGIVVRPPWQMEMFCITG